MPPPPPALHESSATIATDSGLLETTKPGLSLSESQAMALEDSSGGVSLRDTVQLSDPSSAAVKSTAKDPSATDSPTSMKDGSPSDSDGGGGDERPVREKLREANLGTLHRAASDEGIGTDEDAVMGSQTTPSETENAPTADEQVLSDAEESSIAPVPRGRPMRKRSFDDIDVDDVDEDMKPEDANENKTRQGWETGTHARKRSRDVSTGSGSKEHDGEQSVESEVHVHEGLEERNDGPYPSGFSKTKSTLNAGVRTPTEVMDEGKDAEPVLSPRRLERKRSRDQFDRDLEKEELGQAQSRETDEGGVGGEAEPDVTARSASRISRDEPEKKRHRDTSQEAKSKVEEESEIKIPPTSGFANTSAVSPFGTLAGKSPSAFGSSAATFASSAFGALSGSSISPFGTLGTSPPSSSPFGPSGANKGAGASGFGALLSAGKPGSLPSSNFGGAPFGMTSSGFGALGGGFGGSTGANLKDFSSNGSSAILGLKEKPPRPFGAPEDESEESEDEATDDEANEGDRKGGKDGKRTDVDVEKGFHPRGGMHFVSWIATLSRPETPPSLRKHFSDEFSAFIVETGEEHETTLFSCRAKLFSFDGGERAWKERGIGTFKLNATVIETDNEYDQWSRSSGGSEGEEADIPTTKKNTENTVNAGPAQEARNTERRNARLLMRADGVLRVILNVLIFKGMVAGDGKGNLPTGRVVNLTVVEEGKPVPLLIKTPDPESAKKLCNTIYGIQEEM
ncbi:MAG: hypothetical protein M1840_002862 [Geoglossum simile]|nr:MAG: hypothetical protein M1840_002862 [Geoglossum simile]